MGATSAAAQSWYVSGHIGASWPKKTVSDFDSPGLPGGLGYITTEADTGYRLGGAVGYIFNKTFRAEAELSYSHNDIATLDITSFAFPKGTGPLTGTGSASTLMGMFNVYASLPMDRWRPYVGAGIGAVQASANKVSFVGAPAGGYTDDSATAFGWQLMAGVGYQLTSQLEVGARYRFLNVGDYTLHNSVGDAQRIHETNSHGPELTLTWAW